MRADPPQDASASPKIYMYNLENNWTHGEHPDYPDKSWRYTNYGAEAAIPLELKDSPHLTTDPAEADFFYVNAFFYRRMGVATPDGKCIVEEMSSADFKRNHY